MLSRAARSSSALTFRAAGSSPSLLSPATRCAVASYSSSRRRSQRSWDDGIPASWYDARCRSTTILSVRKDDKVVRDPIALPAHHASYGRPGCLRR